jgi:hypothetical protein
MRALGSGISGVAARTVESRCYEKKALPLARRPHGSRSEHRGRLRVRWFGADRRGYREGSSPGSAGAGTGSACERAHGRDPVSTVQGEDSADCVRSGLQSDLRCAKT